MTSEIVARRNSEQQKAVELFFDILLPAAMAKRRAENQQSDSLPPTTTARTQQNINPFRRSISAIKAGTPSLLASLRQPSRSNNTIRQVSHGDTLSSVTQHVCTISMLVAVAEGDTTTLPPITDTNYNVSVVTGPPTPMFSNNPAWTSTASVTTRRSVTNQPMPASRTPSTPEELTSPTSEDRTAIEDAIRSLKLQTAALEARLTDSLQHHAETPAIQSGEPTARNAAGSDDSSIPGSPSPATATIVNSPATATIVNSASPDSNRTRSDLIFSEVDMLSPARPKYRLPLLRSTPEADCIITAHLRRRVHTQLIKVLKKETAAADELRRLMHVALKAAAKARIKKQIVDDIQNKYELYMRAQQIREEIAATAAEANMVQRQVAPVRAMARELLGLSPHSFPLVTQQEASSYMRIKGLGIAAVYSMSELYEISRSIAEHHGTHRPVSTVVPINPPDPPATQPAERPMPDLVSESGSTQVSSDSSTIPDLASASTSGSDSDDSQAHILSNVDLPGSTLYGEEARDRLPLIYELPLEVQRHEVNYRMNTANASSDYWRPSPLAVAELLDPVTLCGLKECDACDQAIKVSTSRYRLFRDDPDEQGRDECNASAAQAEHLRDMAYAEHLQSSLNDPNNRHNTVGVDHCWKYRHLAIAD